jgi:hypothetical protein
MALTAEELHPLSEARHRADVQVQHCLYLASLHQHPSTAIAALDEAAARVRKLLAAAEQARRALKAQLKEGKPDA